MEEFKIEDNTFKNKVNIDQKQEDECETQENIFPFPDSQTNEEIKRLFSLIYAKSFENIPILAKICSQFPFHIITDFIPVQLIAKIGEALLKHEIDEQIIPDSIFLFALASKPRQISCNYILTTELINLIISIISVNIFLIKYGLIAITNIYRTDTRQFHGIILNSNLFNFLFSLDEKIVTRPIVRICVDLFSASVEINRPDIVPNAVQLAIRIINSGFPEILSHFLVALGRHFSVQSFTRNFIETDLINVLLSVIDTHVSKNEKEKADELMISAALLPFCAIYDIDDINFVVSLIRKGFVDILNKIIVIDYPVLQNIAISLLDKSIMVEQPILDHIVTQDIINIICEDSQRGAFEARKSFVVFICNIIASIHTKELIDPIWRIVVPPLFMYLEADDVETIIPICNALSMILHAVPESIDLFHECEAIDILSSLLDTLENQPQIEACSALLQILEPEN